jgi:hypothetical protein
MSIDLKVYDNGDHTCLVWLTSNAQAIPNCRGFTIQREKTSVGAQAIQNYLHGFVGFSDADKLDPNAPWKFPLQRYMWWDYGVAPGDVVQYSVIPVVGPDKDHLELSLADASAQTPPMTITGQASAHVSAYFNKGIVSAQWVARSLAAVGKNASLSDMIGKPGDPLRNALSGLLRPRLLDLLDDVKKNGGEIYLALYELNDPELIPRLTALGPKCHLILANGAFKPPTNDENRAVRAQLHGKVDLHDRLVPQGHFAHNKFVVACDSAGKPQRVLSGSTNWTMTGLCTQANNGIIVDDPNLAAFFLNEWNLLKAAGNAYPTSLMQANSKLSSFNIDGGTITQWFAPTDKGEDLDYARKLINGAEQGILFLFFNPGAFEPDDKPEQWTLLQNILARHQQGAPNQPALYIRGVVNQEIAGLTSEGTGKPSKHAALYPSNPSPVKLFAGANTAPTPLTYDSMVPKAIKDAFHDWAGEVMNQGVHVHSKVIVIDPFGKKPVVITGSHNLGYKASTKNDDNMMIVEGNAPLAAAYAVNIIAIYQNYRWNTYVEEHAKDPKVWHGLVDNATWQDGYLDPKGNDLGEIKFWLGEGASGPAAAGQPTAPPPRAAPGTSAPAPSAGRSPARVATATGPSPHKKGAPAKSAATKKSPAK